MSFQVLFIGGSSRSGSTLIEALLTGASDTVGVGELVDLWRNTYEYDFLCGCGVPLAQCALWPPVVNRALGGAQGLREWHLLQQRVASRAALPRQLLSVRRNSRALERYRAQLKRLYEEIAAVSGARLIVDSSKRPHHAYALFGAHGLQVKALHLVRDSRATAYSWRRRKLRPEARTEGIEMPTHGPWRSNAEWITANALTPVFARRFDVPLLTMRYEDFAIEPHSQSRRLAHFLGLEEGTLLRQLERRGEGTWMKRGPSHSVGGNPVRFAGGSLEIRLDDEWTRGYRAAEYVITTLMTLPQLRRYGYDTSLFTRVRSLNRRRSEPQNREDHGKDDATDPGVGDPGNAAR